MGRTNEEMPLPLRFDGRISNDQENMKWSAGSSDYWNKIKAQTKYTCGHTARVKVYVAEGQEPSSGTPTATIDLLPDMRRKMDEGVVRRLRKYPESKGTRRSMTPCAVCGGPTDTMLSEAL